MYQRNLSIRLSIPVVIALAFMLPSTSACRRKRSTPADQPAAAAPAIRAAQPADADLPTADSLPRTTSAAIEIKNLDAEIAALERRIADGKAPAVRALSPALITSLLTRAQFLATLRDYARADAVAGAYLELYPRDSHALLARARVDARLHRFDQALAGLEDAERMGAASSETSELRMSIGQARGQLDEVVTALETATRARPTILSLGLLGSIYAELGRIPDADGAFRQALASYRNVSPFAVAWLCFQWGRALEQAGEPARAAALYRAAHARLPQYVEATAHLAGILAASDEPARAAELLRALTDQTDSPEILGQLAAIEATLGNQERADELLAAATNGFEALVARFPEAFADHAARYYLGPGNDAARAYQLAWGAMETTRTPIAHALAIEAALAAGKSEPACTAARAALGLPHPARSLRFVAWRAFVGCGDTEHAEAVAAQLGITPP